MQLQHYLNLNDIFGLFNFLFFSFKSVNNYNYIIELD